jgi:hypothetical protein
MIRRDIKLKVKTCRTFCNSLLPSLNLAPGLRKGMTKGLFETCRVRRASTVWWQPRNNEAR